MPSSRGRKGIASAEASVNVAVNLGSMVFGSVDNP